MVLPTRPPWQPLPVTPALAIPSGLGLVTALGTSECRELAIRPTSCVPMGLLESLLQKVAIPPGAEQGVLSPGVQLSYLDWSHLFSP